MTGDESWILYENTTHTAFWIARGSESPTVAKPDLHPHKILLCYWWDSEGILYSEFLPRSRPPPTPISSKIWPKSAEKIDLNVRMSTCFISTLGSCSKGDPEQTRNAWLESGTLSTLFP
ncbi:hypothetical protein WR25_06609 [Diploscapter pachys]|uniref:Uncharacterized protein n=1 Tax=Diploscapter pachys TaxID=2018661 RepID=A0A2A2L159_9BILA|nr:hypothetical protein WR25_06609 [Diploscapter pachys]